MKVTTRHVELARRNPDEFFHRMRVDANIASTLDSASADNPTPDNVKAEAKRYARRSIYWRECLRIAGVLVKEDR